jgi:glucoamylase
MIKPYINNAVIGNGSMLGCISDKGELLRLYWPHIDYPQHLYAFFTGIKLKNIDNSAAWFHEPWLTHEQRYLKDTNVLETVCTNLYAGWRVNQMDFVLPDSNVLIRKYVVENLSDNEMDADIILYSRALSTSPEITCSMYNFTHNALMHYRNSYYTAISGSLKPNGFQLGNNSHDNVRNGKLFGADYIGMMSDGAVSWELGKVAAKSYKEFSIYLSTGSTAKEAIALLKKTKATSVAGLLSHTRVYWEEYTDRAVKLVTGNEKIDRIYRRSILVFALMSDKLGGGLLAAPEIDEDFTKCGRYAYCWGRDAAFITGAMDKCGLSNEVEAFYRWAASIQDDDGCWQQRYHMDGNLAPSWGLQIDETGTIIWGIYSHYIETKNNKFISDMWICVKKGADFLISFIDKETGLPLPSFDLWEERYGEHLYSTAAVYGGITAAAEIADILGLDKNISEKYREAAALIKDAIDRNFWKEDKTRFIRAVRVKLNPWGSEWTENPVMVKINPMGYERDFSREDWKIDISLLGITVPFDVYPANDPKVSVTAELVEKYLGICPAGGLMRYEEDNYIGGNPWVLTTLWAALYHMKAGNMDKVKKYFEWAVNCVTPLDLLPEQVNKETGKPEWVIPLTWSHAMFVLVLFELYGNKDGLI